MVCVAKITALRPVVVPLPAPPVPYVEWLKADLADSSRTEVEAATANPELRLVNVFRAYRNGAPGSGARRAIGVPKLQTAEAAKASPALRREKLRSLGKEDALG